MNLIQREQESDASEIFDDFAIDVEWSGRTLRAIVGEPLTDVDLEVGGFKASASLQLKFRRSDFNGGPYPATNQRVTIGEDVFSILGSNNRPASPFYIITIEK